MRIKDGSESHCSPTDPSLEFDMFEIVRTRLVDALRERGYDLLEAEKIALYTTKGVRCIPKFMKVLTRAETPETEEIIEALERVLDETPALEKAKHILLHQEEPQPEEMTGSKK
jgi:hypothetical protein